MVLLDRPERERERERENLTVNNRRVGGIEVVEGKNTLHCSERLFQ